MKVKILFLGVAFTIALSSQAQENIISSASTQNNYSNIKQSVTDSLRIHSKSIMQKNIGYSIFMSNDSVRIRDNSSGKIHIYSTQYEDSYKSIIEQIRTGKKDVKFKEE